MRRGEREMTGDVELVALVVGALFWMLVLHALFENMKRGEQ